jgi:hypothetical protein
MTQQVVDLDLFKELIVNHEALFNGSASVLTHLSKSFQETAYFSSIIVDKAHLSGNYAANDPAHATFHITKIADDKYTVELPNGGNILVKPFAHESWLAYSSVKCPFRKYTGTAKKVIEAINKWQQKRLALVIEHFDNISPPLSTTNLAYLDPSIKKSA